MATFKSSGTDKDVKVQPTGTGAVKVGTGAAAAVVSSEGDHDLTLQTGNATTGTITITDGADGDISISPNGTGTVVVNTDLDVDNININGNTISSTDTNGDINLTPNGTGSAVISTDLNVDTVKPSTSDGSLSLKGDSGGSATTNGISVDSSGNTSVSGSASLDGAVTINESGADVDFRVESNTVDHALFVQGSDGYVGIGVSSPADKLHVDGNIRLTSGSGINFSDYGATADSNLLDDYEEGTFSVTLTPAGGSMTMDTDRDTFQYVKIGRMVHVQGYTRPSSVSSPTGVVTFSLPFASTVGTEHSYVCYGVAIGENLVSGTSNGFSVRANSDSVTANIFYTAGGKSVSDWSAVGQKFQANTNISINLVYEAA